MPWSFYFGGVEKIPGFARKRTVVFKKHVGLEAQSSLSVVAAGLVVQRDYPLPLPAGYVGPGAEGRGADKVGLAPGSNGVGAAPGGAVRGGKVIRERCGHFLDQWLP